MTSAADFVQRAKRRRHYEGSLRSPIMVFADSFTDGIAVTIDTRDYEPDTGELR